MPTRNQTSENKTPDAELWARLQLGSDRVAFELLHARHNRRLYTVAHAILLDHDLAMEVMSETWLDIVPQSDRPGRHPRELHGAQGVLRYLYVLVRNRSNTLHRQRMRTRKAAEELAARALEEERVELTNQRIDAASASAGQTELLEAALEQLSGSDRELLTLLAEPMPNHMIASLLGIEEGAVNMRIRRVRLRMWGLLSALGFAMPARRRDPAGAGRAPRSGR